MLLRSALTLTALFAVLFSGWSQSANWNASEFPFLCEGESLTLNPLISGLPSPYTFELKYDGLAPDEFGTDVELQPSYTVEALTPGLYEFVLFATNGVTNVFDTLEVEVVPLVAANLALANLDAGFEEIQNAGEPTLFRYCSNTAAVDMVFDVSFDGPIDLTTASVVIDWGDDSSSNQSDFVGSTVSHNYAPGSWQIQVTVTNFTALGLPCSETTVFNVFVGTAPEAAVSLASDKLCLSNNPVAEILLLNSSLTEVTWEILFTDDTPLETLTTSLDSVPFPHTFTRSSCGDSLVTDFGTLYDGFFVSALASNACGFTAFSNLGPFEVSVPPLLNIASDAGAVVCPNEPVGLSNASTPPTLTTGFGCTEDYTFRWELDPAITLLEGDLGSDNGSPNQPESWSSGDMEIEVTSDVPGTHQIALITYTNTACGGDTALFDLTIAEAGVLSLEDAAGDEFLSQEVCSGVAVEDFTFSVEPVSYDITWSVLDADSIPVALGQIPGIDAVAGMSTGTASPSNGWTLTNTDTTAFTILVEAMVPCAASEPLIHEIVVFPEPAIVASPLESTICSGATTDIVLEINTNDAIEWNFTAGPELSGPGSAGPGFAITDTWTNNGLTVDTVLYEIFAASGFQCEGDTVDVIVGVFPAVQLPPLPDVVLCPGDTADAVMFEDIVDAIFTWTNSDVAVGLGSGGQGDIPAWEAASNNTSDSFTSTVSVTGQVASCPLVEATYAIEVQATPTVTAMPTDTTICSGLSPDIELFLNTDDTLHWTATWDPGIVGENGDPLESEGFGPEVVLDNPFFNTGVAPADVVFEVGVVNASNSNLCPTDSAFVTVTVSPGLTPQPFDNDTLCPGEVASEVVLPAIAGVNWEWTNDNPSTGLGADGQGDIPAWVALPNASDTANTGTVAILGIVPGCDPAEVGSYQILVLPAPVIEAMFDNPVCSGDELDAALTWNGQGTASWTADPVAGVQGIESPGSGNVIDDMLVNTNTSVSTVTYVIEIEVPLDAACPGLPDTLQVDVLPQILAGPFDDLNLCPGDTAQPTPTPAIEEVEWSWVTDNVDLGLDSAGLGDVPMWTATNPGTESIEGLVTIFGEAGTCGPQEAGAFNVLVHPTPQAEVTVSPNGSLSCIDSLATIEWTILTDSTELIGFDGGSILTADSLLFDLGSAVVDAAATYIMTLFSTDAECAATQDIVVNPIDDIAITDVLAMNPLCFGEASGAIEVLTDETGVVFYAWTGPSEATDNLATDLLAGDYFVTAINEAGCQDTASVTLSDPEALEVFITDSLKSECGEDNGYLVADAMGGSGALSYTWFGANNAPLVNGSLTLQGIDAGTYTFAAEDANGCVTDTAVFLDCIPLPVPLPSQFISPNGDNKNDLWTIENMVYFSDAKIQVFNRWGIEVFSTEGRYLGDWAGTNKDGKTLPSATYFYVIDTKKKSQRPFNGYLELQTNQP